MKMVIVFRGLRYGTGYVTESVVLGPGIDARVHHCKRTIPGDFLLLGNSLPFFLDHVLQIKFPSLVRATYQGAACDILEAHFLASATKVIKLFGSNVFDHGQVLLRRS